MYITYIENPKQNNGLGNLAKNVVLAYNLLDKYSSI